MNDSDFSRRLLKELPSLMANGVLSEDAAATLRTHYAANESQKPHQIGIVISAILGALLIGAGVILLLAHNWENLGRMARTVISFLPLIVAIALSAWAILRRLSSAAWREGAGIFHLLAIGASISLVSQTYHISGDFGVFVLTWSLLALPLVYLLRSGCSAIGYLAGITTWSGWNADWVNIGESPSLWTWCALVLIAPFYVWIFKRERNSPTTIWVSWALAICVPLILLFQSSAFRSGISGSVILAFSALAAIYYLVACRWFGDERRGFRNPFRTLGCFGIAVLSIALTYREPWQDLNWKMNDATLFHEQIVFLCVVALLSLTAIFLLLDALRKKIDFNWFAGFFSFAVALAMIMNPHAAVLWMNLVALALGVFTIWRGVCNDRLLSMNEGMVIVATLIVVRFFDSEFSFVARGVAFIFIGCGFLAANFIMLKHRKEAK